MQNIPSRTALNAVGSVVAVIPLLSGCVAGIVAVGSMIAAETIDYGVGTSSPKAPEIVGYCSDTSKRHAYLVLSNAYYGGNYGKCAPGDSSIAKSEYDRIMADQSRAYCARKNDQLYRSATATCAAADKKLARDDSEALARNHSTPAVL